MLKITGNRFKDQKGFTLTELLVVFLIIAILAAIAFPIYSTIVDDSKKKADQANAQIVESAVELYAANTGDYPNVTGDTNEDRFNSLISILHSENYIKEEKIETEQKGKKFLYDNTSHKVTVSDDH